MKIPLITRDGQEELGNILHVLSKRKRIVSDFTLDTGSPKTVIPYSQALRLQIPFNSLRKADDFRLAGARYRGYFYHHTQFVFMGERGEKIREDFPAVVLKPTSRTKEQKSGGLPVILGLDFLRERNYSLFCNMSRNIAYLKKHKRS